MTAPGLVFYKMTGSGNDFVFLDGRLSGRDQWPAERIRQVCDRRMGVGADGLVILTPVGPGEVRMDFFNSDGSEASMCGNAALCSSRLSAYLEMADGELTTLLTPAGRVRTRCAGSGHLAELCLPPFDVPVSMEIPTVQGETHIWFGTVGVPHLVVLTEDAGAVDLAARGRELRFHKSLPDGANVNFVSPGATPDAPWLIRTYERGVEGETLACGTGTVAAAVILDAVGQRTLPGDWVTTRGITLSVAGSLEGSRATEAWLCGEGRLVFTGILGSIEPPQNR